MSEWVEHDGNSQPVEDHIIVDLKFRGSKDIPYVSGRISAGRWFWGKDNAPHDIVAYRLR